MKSSLKKKKISMFGTFNEDACDSNSLFIVNWKYLFSLCLVCPDHSWETMPDTTDKDKSSVLC